MCFKVSGYPSHSASESGVSLKLEGWWKVRRPSHTVQGTRSLQLDHIITFCSNQCEFNYKEINECSTEVNEFKLEVGGVYTTPGQSYRRLFHIE